MPRTKISAKDLVSNWTTVYSYLLGKYGYIIIGSTEPLQPGDLAYYPGMTGLYVFEKASYDEAMEQTGDASRRAGEELELPPNELFYYKAKPRLN